MVLQPPFRPFAGGMPTLPYALADRGLFPQRFISPKAFSSRMRQHLYLASNLWDDLWIIQQPTCNEIRREEPVLYVERFVSVFTILRYPKLWRRLFTWMAGARPRGKNLRILAPLPLFHLGHRVPWLFRLEFLLQRAWIRWWVGREPTGDRVLWMDNPLYAGVPGTMGERLSVYHVADQVSAFQTSDAAIMNRLEAMLLDRVDLVFVAAEQLRQDKARRNPHAFTIWNAIDATAVEDDPDAAALRAVEAIPEPRIAFVGVLAEWCDMEMLEAAAGKLPDVHLVFVGPVRADTSRLARRPNVHFLGRQDRGLVPGILRRCSASLVIFRLTALTERIIPLKIFEALAAGVIPICTPFSRDLDALADQGLVRLAASPDELVAQIRAATAADTPAERERLAEFGLRQTWTERWREMSGLIDRRLADTNDGSPSSVE